MIMPKLSVIIPVYGVEKYIERCVRSLFEQTLDDIEYLFIDDCSPDKSIEILKQVLDDYPKRKRQTIIHSMECNSGQAAVRKWGILHASGEYIIHCDSDDWVESNAYEECYDMAKRKDADIVFFDFDRTNGLDFHQHINRDVPVKNKEEIIGKLLSAELMGSLCGSMVKANLYLNEHIWPIGNINEDLVHLLQLVYNASKFEYIPYPYYHYFFNPDSITAINNMQKSTRLFDQSLLNAEVIEKIINKYNYEFQYKQEMYAFYIYKLLYLAPYTNYTSVRYKWKHSFSHSIIKVMFNRHLPIPIKFIYLLTRMRIYPYLYKIRHKKNA